MIFLKRKVLYISMISICIICFAFTLAVNKRENILRGKTMATVALPVTEKTIVLDAGHGKPDEGAESKNGITESSINLQIVFKVQNLLEQAGANVILTRSDEYGIYDDQSNTIKEKKVSDIKNRVKIGNNSEADIMVSIHLNKFSDEKYWGWQTFFKKNNERSKKLAQSIQAGLNESIQKENKRESLKLENVYLIEHVEIPIAIVECGFLSNVEEEKLLQTEEYQNKLAWGIYIGIMNYFFEQ